MPNSMQRLGGLAGLLLGSNARMLVRSAHQSNMPTKNTIIKNIKPNGFKSSSPKTTAALIRKFYKPTTRAQRSDAGKKRS